jgi:ornithine cyclodeaminase/alanine dehydrogenase-like protein (mu-crystallin family)
MFESCRAHSAPCPRTTCELTTAARAAGERCENAQVPLYLTEADVEELLSPADAVEAVEACFRRMAAGAVENRPRYRLGLEGGALAVMAAADLGLGYAGAKVYAGFREGARFAVLLYRADAPELVAVIEADRLGQLRTGAASAVAARHLARADATTLGLIGCGWQAGSQVDCIRVALPSLERVVAYCRTPDRLGEFCERHGAEPGESHRDPAECDVVVTVTTSPDPVLRGEWLRPGTLLCAVGANDGRRRELDNVVLERAAFVCCDSVDGARLEAADLTEPVESGVLDWLEVHELQEVVGGDVRGRQSDDDVVLFKSCGIAAWDVAAAAAVVERARQQGVGVEL